MRPLLGAVLAAAALPGAAVAGGFTDAAGNDGSRAMAAAVFRPVAAAPPVVSGSARVGAQLRASAGAWERQPERHAYRWLRCDGERCAPIAGATVAAYTVSPADAGARLRVEVTASNAGGSSSSLSDFTPTVAAAPEQPRATAPPRISGDALLGATLGASPGTWSDAAASLAYRWLRCDATGGACVAIDGASDHAYVVVRDDIGTTLRVGVTATNEAGSTTTTSDAIGPVTATSVRLPAVAQGDAGDADGPHVLANIADGSWTTSFRTLAPRWPVNAGHWIRLDFGEVRTLTRYVLQHDIREASGYPAFRYAMEASTDGVEWEWLRLPDPIALPRWNGTGDVTLFVPVRARYLRLRARTDAGTGWNVDGIDAFGY